MNDAKKPIRRRDATGHLDPRYARELLEKARETRNDDDSPEASHAFLKRAQSNEALSEELGEGFIQAATSGESESDRSDQVTAEENGGPFIETEGAEEFAEGTDESNIPSATREPLPRTSKAEP